MDINRPASQFRSLVWSHKKTRLVVSRALVRLFCSGNRDDRADAVHAAERLGLLEAERWMKERAVLAQREEQA